MGQQLIGRPISQQSSFGTLNTASSPFAVDQSQYRGFRTPQPMQASTLPAIARAPGVLGFRTARPAWANSAFGIIQHGAQMQRSG